jgi:hypothetical protein
VAIDPAANKIYWDSFDTGAIRVANLDGMGTASPLFGGEGPRFSPRCCARRWGGAADHLRCRRDR